MYVGTGIYALAMLEHAIKLGCFCAWNVRICGQLCHRAQPFSLHRNSLCALPVQLRPHRPIPSPGPPPSPSSPLPLFPPLPPLPLAPQPSTQGMARNWSCGGCQHFICMSSQGQVLRGSDGTGGTRSSLWSTLAGVVRAGWRGLFLGCRGRGRDRAVEAEDKAWRGAGPRDDSMLKLR